MSNNLEYEPIRLIDEVSTTEIYIGTSKNGNNTNNMVWKIKRIWQEGTIWYFGFPDGDQNFNYIWDDRFTYDYVT